MYSGAYDVPMHHVINKEKEITTAGRLSTCQRAIVSSIHHHMLLKFKH